MATPYLPSVEIRQAIHFDTLLAKAMDDVERLATSTWTDHAEHDPGITLLQALAYAVSDLAYRHTLPLIDLLTPEDTEGLHGIFPAGFGPEQALTCGPITEDDYRRALLDLHSTGTPTGVFLFRNVQLVRETADEQYSFFYDPSRRQYVFQPAAAGDEGFETRRVAGTYRLYVELNRGALQAQAEQKLQAFLTDHRNLCEHIRTVTWLAAHSPDIHVLVDVDDDCTDPARILARIYEAGEALCRPEAQRTSAAVLKAQGVSVEQIYEGPRLRHGWVWQLPPSLALNSSQAASIVPLANAVLAIEGVASIRHLSWNVSPTVNWVTTVPVNKYLLPWGGEPLDRVLATVKLYKRGQQLIVTKAQIQAYLSPPELINEGDSALPFGRHRYPSQYFYASQRLPACYGLHEPQPTPEQRQLHQFLLPFEQTLIDGCSLLAQLPELLSFERRADDVVWGDSRWPFPEDSVPNQVHAPYKAALRAESESRIVDEAKELETVDYLLGYFGESRASRTLWTEPDGSRELLDVQQAYLAGLANIGYQRASLRIDEVSALQRRIAARLGIGLNMFDKPCNVRELPFYVVEHRALLPSEPNPAYNTPQNLTGVAGTMPVLTLTSASALTLKVGQLIDLLILESGEPKVTVSQLMVSAIRAKAFDVRADDHAQLAINFDRLLATDAASLKWRNSDAWLSDMAFQLQYSPDQDGVPAGQKRLKVEPYPVHVKVNDVLSVTVAEAPVTSQEARAPFEATVQSVDPLQGTLLASGTWPDEPRSYQWQLPVNPALDPFSFTVSVVFRRSALANSAEPALKAAWFEEVVRSELPAHIAVQIHWLDDSPSSSSFTQFASSYQAWQNGGAALGDQAYVLLEALSIGQVPRGNTGIGATYIATDTQSAHATDPWNAEYIRANELLYVPPEEAE